MVCQMHCLCAACLVCSRTGVWHDISVEKYDIIIYIYRVISLGRDMHYGVIRVGLMDVQNLFRTYGWKKLGRNLFRTGFGRVLDVQNCPKLSKTVPQCLI